MTTKITTTDNLNQIAQAAHALAQEKGWYDKPETDLQFTARGCSNLHGEISELWEAARKGTLQSPCDKMPQLTALEEELADIIIRTGDMAARLNVDLARAVALKHEYNQGRAYRHGGKQA